MVKKIRYKARLPVETVLVLKKAHHVVESKKKKREKNKCREFKKNWKKYV